MARCSLLLMVTSVVLGSSLATEIPREDSEHTMDCTGSGELQYIMLHREGLAYFPERVYEEQQLQIFSNGSVFFHSLKVEYEGIHLCVRKVGNDYHGHTTKLRVRPKPPKDLWGEVYESMFVTGFLSALVVAAIFALGCVVYKYQWRPKETDAVPIVTAGYDNPVMVSADDVNSVMVSAEDVESNSITKM